MKLLSDPWPYHLPEGYQRIADDTRYAIELLDDLLEPSEREELEPFAYLRLLFERLPGLPADRVHELAPAALAQADAATAA